MLSFLQIFGLALAVRLMTLTDRMTHVDDIGWLFFVGDAGSATDSARRVASHMTYAPAQFFLDFSLWRMADDWKSLLFWMRFPSAFFGALGVAFGILVLGKLVSNDDGKRIGISALIFTSILLFFNLRAGIESQQGYTYAVTLPFYFLIFAGLINFPNLTDFKKWILRVGLVMGTAAIGVWFTYQMAMVMACVGLTIFVFFVRDFLKTLNAHNVASRAMGIAAVLAVTLVIFNPVYQEFIKPHLASNRGVPLWANNEVPQYVQGDLLANILLLPKYFFDVLLNLFSYNVTPIWPDTFSSPTMFKYSFGLPLLVLALIGAGSSLIKGTPRDRRLAGVFATVCLAVFLAGNAALKFPLGTTRHSHVLLAPSLVLIYLGTASMANLMNRLLGAKHEKLRFWTMTAAMSLGVVAIVWNMPRFFDATDNKVDLAWLQNQISEDKVTHLVGVDWTWDPFIANIGLKRKGKTFVEHFVIDDSGDGPLFTKELNEGKFDSELKAGKSIYWISHREPLLERVKARLTRQDVLVEEIKHVPAIGSTELSGILNGGNGFFVVRLKLL